MRCSIYVLILFICFSCKDKAQSTDEATNTKPVIEVTFKPVDSATLNQGKLLRVTDFPTQYITPRPVDVWLPESYSENKKYSVLYMHDGQMLFDSTTTWNKQEWKVDEWAYKLMQDNKVEDFIVVGIHNIPKIRWQDLFPEKAMNYMDEELKDSLVSSAKKNNLNVNFNGDDYLKFLVQELKPVIDSKFKVHTDQNHTFVMGSSMGGLMSMYAISEYPQVFGGAACLSTHWVGAMPMEDNPYPDAIFAYMAENLPNTDNHKLYFDYGNKTLDRYYPQFASRVDDLFEANGYNDNNFKNLYFEGTDHSESSWNKRLDQPLVFLLGK